MKKITAVLIAFYSFSLLSMHKITKSSIPFVTTSCNQHFITNIFNPLTGSAKILTINTSALTHPCIIQKILEAKNKQTSIKILVGKKWITPVEDSSETVSLLKKHAIETKVIDQNKDTTCLFEGDNTTLVTLDSALSMRGLLEAYGTVSTEQRLIDKFLQDFNDQWK